MERKAIRDVQLSPERIKNFWARFKKHKDGCWIWSGGHTRGRVEYGTLTLRRSEGRVTINTHRVAWMLTYGPIPDGKQVLHTCDFGLCGNPAHLFLGTQQDNVDDMFAKDRFRDSPLKDEKVIAVLWKRFSAGHTVLSIAQALGVTPGSVNLVLRGESWLRTTQRLGYVPVARGRGNYATNCHGSPGSKNPMAKITEDTVRNIRRMKREGVQQNVIAKKVGMSAMTISHIVNGKSWTHVPETGGSIACS